MVKYFSSKSKAYSNSKTQCPCGGYYTDAVYSGAYANIDPQTNHEATNMHQEFIKNGNKMSSVVKAKLEKKERKVKEDKDAAIALKREKQILCGCGSYYNDDLKRKEKHFETAKHSKWESKNN